MTQKEKSEVAAKILLAVLIAGFLISSIIQFGTGYGEKSRCEETTTADITQIRKYSSRGLVDKTVYYEFVAEDILYKCTDQFSFFVSYPSSAKEIVHYNAQKPSESYLGDTPCGVRNGWKDLSVAIIFGVVFFMWSRYFGLSGVLR